MNLTLPEACGIAQRRQSLHLRRHGHTSAELAATLEATGWLRTIGGIEAYIALHNRVDGATRAVVDDALGTGAIRVMPAVRGCIYVVPERMSGYLLKLAEHLSRRRIETELQKLGSSLAELRDVGDAVLEILAGGALATDQIRKKAPAGVIRGFGDAGKKLGVSSNLPGALRELEFQGRVERVLETGRLDSERYLWRLSVKDRLPGTGDDPATWMMEIGRSFWQHAGFADKADFAEWAGISQKDAKAVAMALQLVPVTVDGYGKEVYALPEALDERSPVNVPRLLSFEDNLYALHGGVGPFVDAEHRDVQVRGWGNGRALVALGGAKHVESRTITTSGRIAGLWEWDAARDEVVVHTLGDVDRAMLDVERASLRRLIHEIGHARTFSLDTDAHVQGRAEALRQGAVSAASCADS